MWTSQCEFISLQKCNDISVYEYWRKRSPGKFKFLLVWGYSTVEVAIKTKSPTTLDFIDDVALFVTVLDFEAIIKYNQNNYTHILLKVYKFTLKHNDQGQNLLFFSGKRESYVVLIFISSQRVFHVPENVEKLPTQTSERGR